jgi:fructosamine-3-kinase
VSALRRRVAALTGVPEARIERLAGGDLSEVLLVRRPDGRVSVAKGGGAVAAEAAMLRALAGAGVPAPAVEAEHDGVLMLAFVANDGVLSAGAWAQIGTALRRLHDRNGAHYGWPVDYRIGTVDLPNASSDDWAAFWGGQRLLSTAALLDRPWRDRVERLVPRLAELLAHAPAPAHLHGDLWTGNILVESGRLAAFIDPACYYGDAEVDLAMLTLFDAPPDAFWSAYGPLAGGWRARRPLYQLFPALLHLRLFGSRYGGLVDRLLGSIEA